MYIYICTIDIIKSILKAKKKKKTQKYSLIYKNIDSGLFMEL